MYLDFFGLRHEPFAGTLDTSAYFPASGHEQALTLLKSCLRSTDSFGLLLGPTGTGKTLLSHLLLDTLDPAATAVFLTNTHLPSISALFQSILFDLSQPFEGFSEQELRLRLTDILIERYRLSGRTLLLIDEAQHLSNDQLEELRLLSNLEGRRDRALQVILFGGETLAQRISDPALDPLRQRISVIASLKPLDMENTVEMIHHMVSQAGGSSASIFTASALADIFERSGGIPRRIIQLCRRSMLDAVEHDSGTVDSANVMAAATMLWLDEEPEIKHIHHPQTGILPLRAAKRDRIEIPENPPYLEIGAGVTPMPPTNAAAIHEGEDEPAVIEQEIVVDRRQPAPKKEMPRTASKHLQLHNQGGPRS